MPNSALEQALKEAYASAPKVPILDTIEIRHPAFTAPIRVVRDWVAVTLRLEDTAPLDAGEWVEFQPYAFTFARPSVNDSGGGEFEITIDDVDAMILDNIRKARRTAQPVEATYRPYLASDLSTPQMDPPFHFVIGNVASDLMQITGRGSFGDYVNLQYPREDYTGARFPGLVR